MPQQSRFAHVIYLFTLGMLCAFGPICTDLYLPALPDIVSDLHTDPSLVQMTLTAVFVGLSIGQIIIGPLSDAYGRKGPLLVSLIIFAVSSYFCAAATEIHTLLFWRLFQGLSGAGGLVLSRAIAADVFKGPALTQFVALLMAINSSAPLLGPVIGSVIVTYASWHTIFYFLTVWGIILFILSFLDVPETHKVEKGQRDVAGAVVSMFRELFNLKFTLYLLGVTFVMAGFFGYISASSFIFQNIYSFSPLQYSLTFGSNCVVMAVFGAVVGKLSRTVSEKRIVLWALSFMLIPCAFSVFVALTVPESPFFILGAIMLFCAGSSSVQTAGFSLVMMAKNGGAGAASGMFGVATFLLGAIASPFMGLMGDRSMLPMALGFTISTLMSLILIILALRQK